MGWLWGLVRDFGPELLLPALFGFWVTGLARWTARRRVPEEYERALRTQALNCLYRGVLPAEVMVGDHFLAEVEWRRARLLSSRPWWRRTLAWAAVVLLVLAPAELVTDHDAGGAVTFLVLSFLALLFDGRAWWDRIKLRYLARVEGRCLRKFAA